MIPRTVHQSGPSQLSIEWDDGHRSRYTLQRLRDQCPCASCKADREDHGMVALPVVSPGKYELRAIEPVGSYALQITWGDGHRTGIYTYEYLRYLCECEVCTAINVGR